MAGDRQRIRDVIDGEVQSMARLVTSASLLDNRPVIGLLFGTSLETESSYYVCITELTDAG